MQRKHFLTCAKRRGLLAGFAVLLIAVMFIPAGCDTGTGGDTGSPKVVESRYRFSLNLTTGDSPEPYATFTLGENSIVWEKITGGEEIPNSYTLPGVYTAGGGTWTWTAGEQNSSGVWAYLYDGSGKRGFVMLETQGNGEGDIVVELGSNVDAGNFSASFSAYSFDPVYDPDGIIATPSGEYASD